MINELFDLTAEELEKVDIARMNLLCAVGLPGAESLNEQSIGQYLARIDQWAEKVKFETERHLYRLTDPRFKDHAEHFHHSEARFRAQWLIDVLQREIGARYHDRFVPQDQANPPFETSKETFIHGLVEHPDASQAFGGNCVSLPVLYAAVGRRLGYPVKLVTSKEHVFCRWVGEEHANPAWRDNFNFDGAGEGFSIDPDEFYMSWPRTSTAAEVERHDWFKPLSPEKELSLFLAQRGHVLQQVAQDELGAMVAYAQAYKLWPTSRNSLIFLRKTVQSRPTVVLVDDFADPRPWWHTAEGQAANLAEIRELERLNAINRRNMQRLPHPDYVRSGVWPYQPPGPPVHPNPYELAPGHPYSQY